MTATTAGFDSAAKQHFGAAARALDRGEFARAAAALQPLAAAYPDHPEVLRLEAGLLSGRGEHAAAVATMRRAIAAHPASAVFQNTFATILAEAGDLDAAIIALEAARRLQPGNTAATYNLGILQVRRGRLDEAERSLREVAAQSPQNLQAQLQLADLLRMRGATDAALAAYRSLIERAPWCGGAWWGLAELRAAPFDDADRTAMQAALVRSEATPEDRIAIGYALARAFEDAGRLDESLAQLSRAKAQAAARQPWPAAAFSRTVDAVVAAFTPPPASLAPPDAGHGIIFITGLPRSGTTLAEQILASHPEVEGAGELPDLALVIAGEGRRRDASYPGWVASASPDDWARLGALYLERTAFRRRERPRMVDKMPGNWLHAGAIRAMLPGARIVVCRRDPLETCLACYRQRLPGNLYANSFEDLAAYWHDFDRFVAAMRTLHPRALHELDHEKLLADPEATIRSLLESCDLPFDPACVAFHRNPRAVGTPSAAQVREPLRRDTSRAARYGTLLDPLRTALERPRMVPEPR